MPRDPTPAEKPVPNRSPPPASRAQHPGWWSSHRLAVLTIGGAVLFGVAVAAAGIGFSDWQDPPAVVAVPAAPAVAAPVAIPVPSPAPVLPTRSYAELLSSQARDLQIARFADNNRVLVLDFTSLSDQGRMFNRLAALIEKNGAPHDRVMSEQELGQLIEASQSSADTFYYGHDYRAADIARFFSLAAAEGMALNPDEQRLRQIALDAGVIHPANGSFVAGTPDQAIISATQIQADNPATPFMEAVDAPFRAAVLRHELSHGEYFTNPAYRAYCATFWNTKLTEAERGLFRSYLKNSGYDPADEDLMINETQAFLVNTPDPRIFNAAGLGVSEDELADLRRRFMDGAPDVGILRAVSPLASP